MKILYVEDEIRKHKNKIRTLFEPVLPRRIIRRLDALLEDKFATPEEIQEVLNSGDVLVVARNFMEAMRHIQEHLNQFALFIVDRNLSENLQYDYESDSDDQYFDAVKTVYPEYTEELHIKYALSQREGDFLLGKYNAIRNESINAVVEVVKDIRKSPNMNQAAVKKNFGSLRVVIPALLDDINKIPDLKFHDRKGKITERNRINWLDGNRKTAVLKPYCDFIYSVTSDVALHEPGYDGLPTIHTLNSAISAFKDIFKWIDSNLESLD